MTRRFAELDGLRGVAAFVVIIFHFLCVFAPSSIPNYGGGNRLSDTPLSLAFNGPFAVSIFFVLSGFVLSNSVAGRGRSFWSLLPIRYLRLAVPALTSCLFAWILIRLHPSTVGQLRIIVAQQPWHSYTMPSLIEPIKQGLWDAFRWGTVELNSSLWTMRIELIGSFWVYAIYCLADDLWTLPIIAAMATMSILMPNYTAYLGFALGCGLREAYARDMLRSRLAIPALVVGCLLGSQMLGFAERVGLHPRSAEFALGDPNSIFYPLAAAMIVYAVISTKRIGSVFRLRLPSFLGRVSFPLYLLHWPILFTISSVIAGEGWTPTGVALPAVFVVFAGASISMAWIAAVYGDEPLLRMLHFSRLAFKGRCRLSWRYNEDSLRWLHK